MAYKTNINYNRKRSYKSRFDRRLKKVREGRSKKTWSRLALKKGNFKSKVKKALGITAGVVFVLLFIATIFVLSIVAKYSSELPDPDKPFEKGQNLTSYMYDRNGQELYRIHGDENRDIAKIEDIPIEVQWAFVSAEDIDFYTHKGVDVGGIVKGALYECCKIGKPRGGSTITQQMIKNTVLTSERSYERKVKEIILSLRVEQKYDKADILQLYMNEIGFGGNTYGIKTAARVYFNKDLKDLTLGEAALLAGLPNQPGVLSPLFASDVTKARELAIQRQHIILNMMKEKKDQINAYARKYNNYEGDLITDEKIDAAKAQELVYQTGKINIEAPHFVFYAEDELTKEDSKYNNGRPFTHAEIERGGLKITTSLDLDMQQIAEQSVKEGLEKFAKPNGANNVALVTIDPKTGQILAMVGSADYFGVPSPEGCTLGKDCKFEPNVNVANSIRQPGSSLKPIVSLSGFETGQLYPASFVPDIPITFAGGYTPKNNDGGFHNTRTLRQAMANSYNIPFVQALEIIGVTQFLDTLSKLGYTTFTSPENYGAALALGAGDVKLVEHTNAYAVLATQGIYHPLSPILKIEDKDGNVIYDYTKDTTRAGVRVVDERAAYLVNDVIRNYHVHPAQDKLPTDMDYAGKTGTSDANKNNYYMGYTTEVVTGIWCGNNDNSSMHNSAFGVTTALPIWKDYMRRIIGRYSSTRFVRPGGIVSASVCDDSGLLANDKCTPISDLFIQDKLPPEDTYHKIYRVCSDQPDNLARPIDEQMGFAVDKVYRYIKAPKEEWQQYFDKAFGQGAPPTASCTINRNPTGNNKPWVVISSPVSGTAVNQGANLNVDAKGFSSSFDVTQLDVYIGSTLITNAPNNPFTGTITVPAGLADGYYEFKVVATDSSGQKGSSSVSILVGDIISFVSPSNGSQVVIGASVSVNGSYVGANSVSYAKLTIIKPDSTSTEVNMTAAGSNKFNTSFIADQLGNYKLKITMHLSDGSDISTGQITVTSVNEIIMPEDPFL